MITRDVIINNCAKLVQQGAVMAGRSDTISFALSYALE